MLQILRPSKEPCFLCLATKDTAEVKIDNQQMTLCWKDIRQLFKRRNNHEREAIHDSRTE